MIYYKSSPHILYKPQIVYTVFTSINFYHKAYDIKVKKVTYKDLQINKDDILFIVCDHILLLRLEQKLGYMVA